METWFILRNMHEGALTVHSAVVASLLQEQLPQYAHLEVSELKSPATVNQIFRLGKDLVCKFPFLPTSREELETESRNFREFGENCSVLVPQLVKILNPSESYPNYWSVYTFIEGEAMTTESHQDSSIIAQNVAELICEIKQTSPRENIFNGHGRGGLLMDHDEDFREYCDLGVGLFDVEKTLAIWDALRTMPAPINLSMCHGDLQPQNLLVKDSRIIGVLDCGSYRVADPALDLLFAWHSFDSKRRAIFRETIGVDGDEWLRGVAWALIQSVGLAKYYETTNPEMSLMGINTINKILKSDEFLQTTAM
ncbi:MAG: phosphotransferase [Candidatus Nanopelagicus sp.]